VSDVPAPQAGTRNHTRGDAIGRRGTHGALDELLDDGEPDDRLNVTLWHLPLLCQSYTSTCVLSERGAPFWMHYSVKKVT